ncbi:MAG: hypothetical protein NTX24_04050 [Candidatus Pacearchaeota archaeon]|nr:hypothetical protein [Candidatus Pacearchaeota archaeon]
MTKPISALQTASMEGNVKIRIGRFQYSCRYLETHVLQDDQEGVHEERLEETLQQAQKFSDKYILAPSPIVTNMLLRAKSGDFNSQQTRARVIQNTRGKPLTRVLTNSVLAVPQEAYPQLDSRLRKEIDRKKEETKLEDWWLFLSFLSRTEGLYSAKSHFWLRRINLIGPGRVFEETDTLYLLNKGRERDVREVLSVITGVPRAYVDDKLRYGPETTAVGRNSVIRTGSGLSSINPIYLETNESGQGEFNFIIDPTRNYTGIGILFKTGLKLSPVLQTKGGKSRFYDLRKSKPL